MHLSDDDVDTAGFMFLMGKSHLPERLVIDQPTFRAHFQLFIQELLTLTRLINVTEVVIQATLSSNVGYLMNMRHLEALTVAYAPNLSFTTMFAATRVLH